MMETSNDSRDKEGKREEEGTPLLHALDEGSSSQPMVPIIKPLEAAFSKSKISIHLLASQDEQMSVELTSVNPASFPVQLQPGDCQEKDNSHPAKNPVSQYSKTGSAGTNSNLESNPFTSKQSCEEAGENIGKLEPGNPNENSSIQIDLNLSKDEETEISSQFSFLKINEDIPVTPEKAGENVDENDDSDSLSSFEVISNETEMTHEMETRRKSEDFQFTQKKEDDRQKERTQDQNPGSLNGYLHKEYSNVDPGKEIEEIPPSVSRVMAIAPLPDSVSQDCQNENEEAILREAPSIPELTPKSMENDKRDVYLTEDILTEKPESSETDSGPQFQGNWIETVKYEPGEVDEEEGKKRIPLQTTDDLSTIKVPDDLTTKMTTDDSSETNNAPADLSTTKTSVDDSPSESFVQTNKTTEDNSKDVSIKNIQLLAPSLSKSTSAPDVTESVSGSKDIFIQESKSSNTTSTRLQSQPNEPVTVQDEPLGKEEEKEEEVQGEITTIKSTDDLPTMEIADDLPIIKTNENDCPSNPWNYLKTQTPLQSSLQNETPPPLLQHKVTVKKNSKDISRDNTKLLTLSLSKSSSTDTTQMPSLNNPEPPKFQSVSTNIHPNDQAKVISIPEPSTLISGCSNASSPKMEDEKPTESMNSTLLHKEMKGTTEKNYLSESKVNAASLLRNFRNKTKQSSGKSQPISSISGDVDTKSHEKSHENKTILPSHTSKSIECQSKVKDLPTKKESIDEVSVAPSSETQKLLPNSCTEPAVAGKSKPSFKEMYLQKQKIQQNPEEIPKPQETNKIQNQQNSTPSNLNAPTPAQNDNLVGAPNSNLEPSPSLTTSLSLARTTDQNKPNQEKHSTLQAMTHSTMKKETEQLSRQIQNSLQPIILQIFHSITIKQILTTKSSTIFHDFNPKAKILQIVCPNSNFSLSPTLIQEILESELTNALTQLDVLCSFLQKFYVDPMELKFQEEIYFQDFLAVHSKNLDKASRAMRLQLKFELHNLYHLDVFKKMDSFMLEYKERNEEISTIEWEANDCILQAIIQHYTEETEFELGDSYMEPQSLNLIHQQVYQECLAIFESSRSYPNPFDPRHPSQVLNEALIPFTKDLSIKNEKNFKSLQNDATVLKEECFKIYENGLEILKIIQRNGTGSGGFKNEGFVEDYERIHFLNRLKAMNYFDETSQYLPLKIVTQTKAEMSPYFQNSLQQMKSHVDFIVQEMERKELERRRLQMEMEAKDREKRRLEEESRKNLELRKWLPNSSTNQQQQNFGGQSHSNPSQRTSYTNPTFESSRSQNTPRATPQCSSSTPPQLESMAVAIHVGLHRTKLGFTTSKGDFQLLFNAQNILYFNRGSMLAFDDEEEDKEALRNKCAILFGSLFMQSDITTLHFVRTSDSDRTFRIEELLSILLAQLKWRVELSLQKSVSDCLIVIPQSFNKVQRQLVRDSAVLAGFLKPRIMNDTHAMALAYLMKEEKLQQPRMVVTANVHEGFIDATSFSLNEDGSLNHVDTSGEFFVPIKNNHSSIGKTLLNIVTLGIANRIRGTPDELKEKVKTVFSKEELNYKSPHVIILSCPADSFEKFRHYTSELQGAMRVDENYPIYGGTLLLRIAESESNDQTYEHWIKITRGLVDFEDFRQRLLKGYPAKFIKSSNNTSGCNMMMYKLKEIANNWFLKKQRGIHEARMTLLSFVKDLQRMGIPSGFKWKGIPGKELLQGYGDRAKRSDEEDRLEEILECVRDLDDIRKQLGGSGTSV